jgi:hypothetical protein
MDFTTLILSRDLLGVEIPADFDRICKAVPTDVRGAAGLETNKKRNGDRVVKIDGQRVVFRFRTRTEKGALTGALEVLASDQRTGQIVEAPRWAVKLADAVQNAAPSRKQGPGKTPVTSNQNQQ